MRFLNLDIRYMDLDKSIDNSKPSSYDLSSLKQKNQFSLYDYIVSSNFFSDSDFNIIVKNLPRDIEYIKEGQFGFKRSKAILRPNHCITNIVKNYLQKIETLVNVKVKQYGEVEIRRYDKGDFFEWHRDFDYINVQGKPIFFECVLTCYNTSDSKTEFMDETTKEIMSVMTIPNQLILLCIQGVKHQVTPVTTGERIILKFKLRSL
jgi:hypothetical protein